jgi:hypothetical protein
MWGLDRWLMCFDIVYVGRCCLVGVVGHCTQTSDPNGNFQALALDISIKLHHIQMNGWHQSFE